ncbi:MAG: alpha/beta fold hydrolase [candidate division KSB1 bacterium]|nr:alpha/beta fold hydrolase [candidate division KSB1 bacterium]
MPRRFLARVGWALLLASVPALGQVVRKDTSFWTDDGVKLDATYFRPAWSPPDSGFPGVVLVHGLGGSKRDMFEIAQILALKGYLALAYSVRGQGESWGLRTFTGERERRDLKSLLGWLGARADVNPRRLAVVGGSQGGQHAWWAALYGLGVRTVVVVAGFTGDLSSNGCIETATLDVVSSDRVRYDETWSKVRRWVLTDQVDSLRALMPSPDSLLQRVKTPVFLSLAYRDWLFSVNEGLRQFELLAGPKCVHLGTGYHGAPVADEATSALYVLALGWLDHYLKDQPLLVTERVVYHVDESWQLRYASSWPPEDTQWVHFYLSPGGRLSVDPRFSSGIFILRQTLLDPSYSPERAMAEGFGPGILSHFECSRLDFVSDPFPEAVEWAGSPECRFSIRWGGPKMQLHVQFYDVDPAGHWRFLQRGNLALRGGSRDTVVVFRGQAYAHVFSIGHRLGVRLVPLDLAEGENRCYVLPFFTDFADTLVASAAVAPRIAMPLRGWRPERVAQRLYRGPKTVDFRLSLPRPNPFNSEVQAELFLPGASAVRVRIYSLEGRLVRTLYEGTLAEGTHVVRWNGFDEAGSAAPSGLYVLSVEAGGRVFSRKLCLIR